MRGTLPSELGARSHSMSLISKPSRCGPPSMRPSAEKCCSPANDGSNAARGPSKHPSAEGEQPPPEGEQPPHAFEKSCSPDETRPLGSVRSIGYRKNRPVQPQHGPGIPNETTGPLVSPRLGHVLARASSGHTAFTTAHRHRHRQRHRRRHRHRHRHRRRRRRRDRGRGRRRCRRSYPRARGVVCSARQQPSPARRKTRA